MLQTAREIEFFSPLGEDVLLFHTMEASDHLGHLFDYKVNLLSEDPNISLQDLLGQSVTIRLQTLEGENRFFNGLVSRFCQLGMVGNYYSYQAQVRPWLWLLSRTADCRIFQNKTIPDIVKEVFRDNGFSDFEEQLNGNYRNWEYCVQYRETDFNFVSRLMEHEGIYYFFKHEDGKHTLIMCDDVGSHESIEGYDEIPYYPPSDSERRESEHINDWQVYQEVQPDSYALNDYDYKKPKADLKVQLSEPFEHAATDKEIFDYPGHYNEFSDGDEYVRIRLEELAAQYEQAQAQGNTRGIYAGGLFSLVNFPRDDQNKEYLITSIRYQLSSNQYESSSVDVLSYQCHFSVLSSDKPYRAPRTTPKPVVQGPQTAVVVGKAGQEIYADKYGCVKVQFHWDRLGTSDENSSCWVRVSHPTAGKNWGSVQIPRIGQEVIVDFLEGDPDRPIITGRVYNDVQKAPYELPGNGMVSGMKSNSTPGGGGYNEMSMNDSKGKELITIHAQFNMDTTVENDQTWTINNNRTTNVAVDDSETIGSNQTISVGADQSTTVGANQTLNVGANQTNTIGSNKSETVAIANTTSIGAAYQITVGAAMNETIGAAKAEEIGGVKSVNVGASSSENIGANKSVDAGGNISEQAGKDISSTSGKKMNLKAGDDFSLNGDKKGVIEFKDKLTIKVGKAIIEMDKSGDITINGKKIQMKGSGDVIIKGKKILQN